MGVRKRPAAAMAEMDTIAKAEAEKKEAEEHRRREQVRLHAALLQRERLKEIRQIRIEFGMEPDPRFDARPTTPSEAESARILAESAQEAGAEPEAEPNPSSGSGWHPDAEEDDLPMPPGSSRNIISPVEDEGAEEEDNPWVGMTTDEEVLSRIADELNEKAAQENLWPDMATEEEEEEDEVATEKAEEVIPVGGLTTEEEDDLFGDG
jgi:hypothetical protein